MSFAPKPARTSHDGKPGLVRQVSKDKEKAADAAQPVAPAVAPPAVAPKPTNPAFAVIKLNVGGVHYESTLATLMSVDNCFFSALFSGRWQPTLADGETVFIDRNGEVLKL